MQQSTYFDLDSIGNRDDGRKKERNNQPGRRWTRERRRHDKLRLQQLTSNVFSPRE